MPPSWPVPSASPMSPAWERPSSRCPRARCWPWTARRAASGRTRRPNSSPNACSARQPTVRHGRKRGSEVPGPRSPGTATTSRSGPISARSGTPGPRWISARTASGCFARSSCSGTARIRRGRMSRSRPIARRPRRWVDVRWSSAPSTRAATNPCPISTCRLKPTLSWAGEVSGCAWPSPRSSPSSCAPSSASRPSTRSRSCSR